jgi:hypothetical protein
MVGGFVRFAPAGLRVISFIDEAGMVSRGVFAGLRVVVMDDSIRILLWFAVGAFVAFVAAFIMLSVALVAWLWSL